MYKRILLKLSGEQLQGDLEKGFDPKRAAWIAKQIKPVIASGTQVVIMVGGGNLVRGGDIAHDYIDEVTAHNAGMLSTMINATLMADVCNHVGLEARALSTVEANQMIDQYTYRRALSHVHKNRVVIVGGGIGRPFLTTDTAALSLALELRCDVVIKTTKVDGVYDKDPAKYDDAIKLDEVTYEQALNDVEISVMDKAAIALAMEERKPLIICDLLTDGNIQKAASGDSVGTIVK